MRRITLKRFEYFAMLCLAVMSSVPSAQGQSGGSPLKFNPAALQFPSQAVGTVSAVRGTRLTNSGAAVASNLVIAVAGDFAQTNTCGTSLAPGATCLIRVTFSPTTSGTRNGALTVSSTATPNPAAVPLTGIGYSLVSITLNPTNPSVAAGTGAQFQATGTYDDGSVSNISNVVQWTSSLTSVATINASGLATAVSAGVTSITAALGSVSASTNLTVTTAKLLSIRVGAQKATIPQGISEQLSAVGKFSDGTTETITNFVSWNSSARGVVTVSPRGLIYSVAAGSATVTAKLGSVIGGKKIAVTTVSLSSIAVSQPPPPFATGTKVQLQATGKFSDGSSQNLTSSVAWSSSNTAIVSVDKLGRASGFSAGSATVTATLGSRTGSKSVTVQSLTLASISVKAGSPSIPAGTKTSFTATGTFSNGQTEGLTLSVHWTSSDPAVATVSNAPGQEGSVQSLTAGTVNIFATYSASISNSAPLTITPAVLVSIAITPANSSLPLGVTEQLAATGTFSDKTQQDLTQSVTWSSSASAVATVSTDPGLQGLVESLATGNATITAASGTITGTTGLTVAAAQLNAVVISPANPSLQAHSTQQFTATGVYTDASTQNLTTGVTWSSSATAVATISNTAGSQGLATTQGAGTTTITAAPPGNAVSGTTTLTVTSIPPPTLSSFSPPSGSIGTPVTVNGTNLQPSTGTLAQVSVSSQSGGTISVAGSSTTSATLQFVIPDGAATGPITVLVNGGSATSATALTVNPSSTFTLTAAPAGATVIQGQSVSYSITLTTTNGFTDLVPLSATGLPDGTTGSFNPAQITAGQISVLTITAPPNEPTGSAPISVSASATVDGILVTGSTNLTLNIEAPTTSFIGRTVVSDALETPLAGVTVTMLGKDGNGNDTQCIGSAVSDAAGNFALLNLSDMCTGPQLVGFNGLTATAPPGQYAGVNLVYTLVSGQVTPSPVLVHLPAINNQETFNVQQNASTDQTYVYKTIPGLVVTVYAGTTLKMPDGTTPDPFPLVGVQVPVDRLPDAKPTVPTMMMAFIVAFQPANAVSNQPVAVTFPNTLNSPPNTNMGLMTLDPTQGTMVPYGTGTVSADGTQVVPDFDPNSPGHRFGIVHFDWHGPMPPPPPDLNPSAGGGGTGAGSGGTCAPVGMYPTSGSFGALGSPGSCVPPPCNTCPPVGGNIQVADPIDLATGIYVSNITDMVLSGARGTVAIQRIYRTLSTNDGPFGIGSGGIYDYILDTGNPNAAQAINLINPDGSRFLFSRQTNGTLINTTVPSLQGAVMTTASNNPTSLRYKDGTVMTFQANGFSQSREVSLIDANGNQITINRNPNALQQILSITDPVGRQLTFTYDTGNPNHITSITDPVGRVVKYAYNSTGTLASVTDPAGDVTQYFYDTQNRLTSVVDPRNNKVLSNDTFDSNGRITKQTQADGSVVQISYELANPQASTSYVRDVTVIDPLGNITFYRFNPQGFVIQVGDALGESTTFTREAGSNLVLTSTGNAECPVCGPVGIGNLTFTYDASGNMLTRTDALGNTTTYTYDPVFNKVTSVTDPLHDVTAFTYDSAGNLLTSTDANGNTTHFQYDRFGELAKVTDPQNQTTVFMYDALGNLMSMTDALGNITSFEYDAIGRQIGAIDALSRRSTTTYDALNRIIKQVDPKGGVTQFAYDANSNLTGVTDARNNTTSFTYDPMNRLATRTDPAGKTDTRTYDFNGNLTTFTDRRGQRSTYAYDPLNRLTTETYLDSTVTRSYDAAGRLQEVDDTAAGAFTYVYDAVGDLLKAVNPFGTVQYIRDALGRATQRQVLGQAAVAYSYDRAGNLLSASMPQASASYTYDSRNEPLKLTRGNGATSQFTYDQLGRVLSIIHSGPGGTLASNTYTYDPVGNRATNEASIAQALITQASASSYDNANRLLRQGTSAFTYDANGNLTSETNSSGTTTYTWDSRGRLASLVTSGGQKTTFLYGFDGLLLQQVDVGPTQNLAQTFLLDDLTNVALLSRSDGDQSSILTGQSLDAHLAAVHANSQIEYGIGDALNSTDATTDQNGSLKGQFLYEPFGQTTASGSNYPFRFTGRVPTANGLYYYRARFYNSLAGRFISEDPFGFAGGVNLYRYVSNEPILLMDPLGMQATVVTSTGTPVNSSGQPYTVVQSPGTSTTTCPYQSRGSCMNYTKFLVCTAATAGSIVADLGEFCLSAAAGNAFGVPACVGVAAASAGAALTCWVASQEPCKQKASFTFTISVPRDQILGY